MTPHKVLLNLCFPPRCPFCAQIKEDDGICSHCQSTLPWISETTTPVQGEYFEACYAPLWYEGLTVPSFHRYKFGGRRRYAKCYGVLLAQCLEDCSFPASTLVTWAPINRSRHRRRGYDQSQLLARELAEHLSLPLVSTLKKWRNTPPQSSLDSDEARASNAQDAYELRKGANLSGKTVILVDDVITSGSTLTQCTRVLQEAGVAKVICVTLARAHRTTESWEK